MKTRKASIKETGEELSPEQWARFDAAVAEVKAMRLADERFACHAAIVKPETLLRETPADRSFP